MKEMRRSCTAPPFQESPLFPFMRQQFSAAPGANELCSISPHLPCGSAVPCHMNTFHAARCVPACAFLSHRFLSFSSLPPPPLHCTLRSLESKHAPLHSQRETSPHLLPQTEPDSGAGPHPLSIHTLNSFIFFSHEQNILKNHQQYCLLQTCCRKLHAFS